MDSAAGLVRPRRKDTGILVLSSLVLSSLVVKVDAAEGVLTVLGDAVVLVMFGEGKVALSPVRCTRE
jgi:hypothetical protein